MSGAPWWADTFVCATCKKETDVDEWCCDWCEECVSCRRKAVTIDSAKDGAS